MAEVAVNAFGTDSEDPKDTVMQYDQQAGGEGHECVILKSLLFETDFQSLEFDPVSGTRQVERLNWSSVIRVSHSICTGSTATEFGASCKLVTNLPGKPT